MIRKRRTIDRETKFQKVVKVAQKHPEMFKKWYGRTYGVRLQEYCLPCVVKDVMIGGKWKEFIKYVEKELISNGLLKPNEKLEI